MNLHISQLMEELQPMELELQADGDRGLIHIKVRPSKNETYWIAESAVESWIENADEEGQVEHDDPIEVGVAIAHLTRSIPVGSEHVDNHFAVCRKLPITGGLDLRVLVWKDNPESKTWSAVQVVPSPKTNKKETRK